MGFSGSSAGKESTCNAGDPGLIPGLGRSPEEGIRLPTPVFLGFPIHLQCGRPRFDPWVGKIPWREGKATHLSILDWKIPTGRGARWATVHGVAKSQT